MSASRSAFLLVLPFIIAFSAAKAQHSAPAQHPVAGPQETFAPYWTSEPGRESELQLKNNLASGSLAVTPVLRLADGTEFSLDPVTIASNAAVSVPVNQVLLKKFPSLLNQPGAYGSVVFRFTSFNAGNLYALVSVQKQGEPIGFHFDAYPPSDHERAGSREGIWWQPRRGMKDLLVIANGSAKTLRGTLWLSDAAGKRWSSPLTLAPYQTQRLPVGTLVRRAGLSGSYGGIAFEIPASAQAIDSVHMLYDERSGFSALMKMVDRNPAATLRERTGADNKPWTLWAPMLPLSAPDAAAGFPAGTVLQPTIFVRNTTAKKLAAGITLTWRGDSGKGRVKLPELSLAPFETRQIQVGAMQKQLGIPSDAHWALVTLTTSAMPDELIVMASSYDVTARYGMQSPIFSGVGDHFMGGEWHADTTHNMLMAITNGGTRATDALLTLYYNNGKDKYEMQRTIQPGDQMWLNFADLIHRRVADRKGRILPADLTSGTYDLRDLNPGRGGQLIGSELALDTTLGQQAQPNILRCCGYEDPGFDPDIEEILFTQNGPLDVQALDCNGWEVDISFDFNNWWSGDDSVAQVTYKNAYGAGQGSTNGYASGWVTVGNAGYCTVVPVQVQVPIYVDCPGSASTTLVQPLGLNQVFPNLLTGIGNVARVTVSPSEVNWNGQEVTEVVSQQSSTCPSKFPACSGNTVFIIGEGYQPAVTENGTYVPVGVYLVATTNEFFDQYSVWSNYSLLDYYGGGNQCTETCSQQYYDWCNVLPIMSHTYTYTFQKSIISGTKVTNVTVSE